VEVVIEARKVVIARLEIIQQIDMLMPQRFEMRPQGLFRRQLSKQARRPHLKHHANLEQLQREVLSEALEEPA
jgi:hypothetical protein